MLEDEFYAEMWADAHEEFYAEMEAYWEPQMEDDYPVSEYRDDEDGYWDDEEGWITPVLVPDTFTNWDEPPF